MKPDRILTTAVLALACLLPQAPAAAAETLVFPIYSRTLFFLPVWLAVRQGYFRDEGLELSLPGGATQDEVAGRLRSGDLGIHIVGPETVFADADDSLRVVAGNAGRLPHFIIAQSRFKTIADLRQANFGVISAHEGTTHLIPEIMQSAGIGPGSYTLSPVGSANVRWTLLKAGRIDAGLQPFPLSYEAEAAGFTNLGWTGRFEPDWQFTAVVVNRRWAEAHREATAGFLRALRRGTEYMGQHRDEAADVAATELGTSPAYARRAIDDALRLGILDASLAVNDAGMRRVFAVSPRPPGVGDYSAARYVDGSYLRAAGAGAAK